MESNVLVFVDDTNDDSDERQEYVGVLCDEQGRPMYAYPV